jgi:hypothetical protein
MVVRKANGSLIKIPMITTDFPNHKGMNVIGLLWLFVDTPHTKLMEQFKNVPSMFHQNSGW